MKPARREFLAGTVAFSAILLGSRRSIAAQQYSAAPEGETFGLNVSELRATAGDARVSPGSSFAYVQISLNEPARQTVSLKYATADETASGDRHFVRQSGFLVFQPGDQIKLVAVKMRTPLGAGEHFNLQVGWPQNAPPVAVEKGTAAVAAGLQDVRMMKSDGCQLPPRPVASEVLFETRMLDFEATDTGLNSAGEPVWMSQLAHGREQPANGELGYYVDPSLHPGSNPWGRNDAGRFYLQAERHPAGIFDAAGKPVVSSAGVPYRFSSSIVTTKRLFNRFTIGCFAEARLQLDPVFGSWPAFWMLPDDERSETLEIDVLEGFFHQYDPSPPNLEMLGTTVHWDGGTAGHQMYSQSASILESIIPGFDAFAPHVWGVHWGESTLTFYVDDVPYFQLPNMLPAKNCYMLLNIAVGGEAGVPDVGRRFSPRLYVDWVRVSRIG